MPEPRPDAVPRLHLISNWILQTAFRVVLRLRVQGRERVIERGGLIIASNHANFLDPPIALSLMRSDAFPMGKSELFKGVFGWIIRQYGAFPVRRGEADLAAFRTALKILQRGHAMYLSPEGTRTKSGTLQEAHEGIALIAIRSRAPIQPVAIVGAKMFWKNLRRLRPTPVEFIIGQPLRLRALSGKPTREELRAITDELMYHIAELMPPEYRGDYAGLAQAAHNYLVPMEREEVMPLKK